MDLSRYLGLFVTDAREHLAGLEKATLQLETAPDPRAPLDALFRHLHSLKSSCATMGFTAMARLAHLAEDVTGAARQTGAAPDAAFVEALLQVRDALARMVEVAEAGDQPQPDAAVLTTLAALTLGTASVKPPAPEADAAPLRPEQPHTLVSVRVAAGAAAPAARAFLALRRLEAVAQVLSTQPALDALRAGQLPGHRLLVALDGQVPLESLQKAVARVPDVAEISLANDAPAATPPVDEKPSITVEPAATFVRVRAELLDELLELSGELLLAGARLRELVRPLPEGVRDPLEEETDRLRLRVKELNNHVLAARQTPVTLLSDRLPRTVRELGRKLGKEVSLTVEGGEVTADRGLLEALTAPLLHVLRNAIDHGLESPAERVAAGKPAQGRLVFAARRERDRVLIELRDDGRGFDPARLKQKAVKAGLLTPQAAEALDDAAALRLSFAPGLSTRDTVNELSGRGVGMDAVLRSAEQLGGTVLLESRIGHGSVVRWVLPVAASVTNVLLVGLGDEIFGLPMSRVLFAQAADAVPPRTLQIGQDEVPSFALGKLLGLADGITSGERPYVLVDAEGHRVAVGVDALLGQEEVVLRPLVPPLERITGLGGTAILGSGRPIFVLDLPQLVA